LALPASNSSSKCFSPGRINKNLALEDRVLRYPICGFALDRDLKASLILLRRVEWVPPFGCAWGASPDTSPTTPRLTREREEARWGVTREAPFLWEEVIPLGSKNNF